MRSSSIFSSSRSPSAHDQGTRPATWRLSRHFAIDRLINANSSSGPISHQTLVSSALLKETRLQSMACSWRTSIPVSSSPLKKEDQRAWHAYKERHFRIVNAEVVKRLGGLLPGRRIEEDDIYFSFVSLTKVATLWQETERKDKTSTCQSYL